jgi:chromosome segregation ATPase
MGYMNELEESASFCPPTLNNKESSIENLCLMAHEDEVISELNSLEYDSYNYDELQNAFDELVEELKKTGLKNKNLKNKTTSTLNEVDNLKNKIQTLENDKNTLKKKNEILEKKSKFLE